MLDGFCSPLEYVAYRAVLGLKHSHFHTLGVARRKDRDKEKRRRFGSTDLFPPKGFFRGKTIVPHHGNRCSTGPIYTRTSVKCGETTPSFTIGPELLPRTKIHLFPTTALTEAQSWEWRLSPLACVCPRFLLGQL